MFNCNLDELFSYDTLAVVRVKDRRLGILNYTLFVVIFAYIVGFQIIYQKNFLLKETPNGGSIQIRTKNAEYSNLNTSDVEGLAYCNDIQCKLGYLTHGLEDSSTFITTRLTLSRSNRFIGGCSEPASLTSNPDCLYKIDENSKKQTYYLALVEKSTLIIEHQVRGEKTGINQDFKKMDGKLSVKDKNRKTVKVIKRFNKDRPLKDYAFSLEELLEAAGVDLDNTNKSEDSNRYNGLVIIVFIEYRNNLKSFNQVTYDITAKAIPDAEFKYEHLEHTDVFPNTKFDPNIITFMNEHGVRIIIKQTGELGKFDLITLLINLVTGMALIKVSTLVVDLVMINLLPEKKKYEEYKIKETEEFKNIRIKSHPQTIQLNNLSRKEDDDD